MYICVKGSSTNVRRGEQSQEEEREEWREGIEKRRDLDLEDVDCGVRHV